MLRQDIYSRVSDNGNLVFSVDGCSASSEGVSWTISRSRLSIPVPRVLEGPPGRGQQGTGSARRQTISGSWCNEHRRISEHAGKKGSSSCLKSLCYLESMREDHRRQLLVNHLVVFSATGGKCKEAGRVRKQWSLERKRSVMRKDEKCSERGCCDDFCGRGKRKSWHCNEGRSDA